MNIISTTLVPGLKSALKYSHALLADIPDDIYARKIEVNGKPLEAVHPAFHVGHLGTYPTKVYTLLGIDTAQVAHPKEWDALFVKGSVCHDDPDGSLYPARKALETHFFDSYQHMTKTLPSVSDEVFVKENPFEASRERFETAGQFAAYLLGAHILGHLGQLSTWRRVAGLGSVY